METRRLWRMWWSGLFALAAGIHLLRALVNIPVTIGTVAIPIWASWVIFPLTGFIAGWLMRVALERKQQIPSRPPPMTPCSFHPKLIGKEEPQYAGQTYCGVHAGASDLGDDWPGDD